jgi:hypothetical protein
LSEVNILQLIFSLGEHLLGIPNKDKQTSLTSLSKEMIVEKASFAGSVVSKALKASKTDRFALAGNLKSPFMTCPPFVAFHNLYVASVMMPKLYPAPPYSPEEFSVLGF